MLQENGSLKWKTKNKMGACPGKITLENGFIPNAKRELEEEITVLDYGNLAFSKLNSSRNFPELDALFSRNLAIKVYSAGKVLW